MLTALQLAERCTLHTLQVLANAFRKYPIWTFIQPRDEKRRALLRWVLKRYLRGLLANSGRKQGHAFAVRQSTAGDLAGIVLLWRPRSAGGAHVLRSPLGMHACSGLHLHGCFRDYRSHGVHTSHY